jgi:hypothetical protein
MVAINRDGGSPNINNILVVDDFYYNLRALLFLLGWYGRAGTQQNEKLCKNNPGTLLPSSNPDRQEQPKLQKCSFHQL